MTGIVSVPTTNVLPDDAEISWRRRN